PSARKRRARSRPMPLLAPVITTRSMRLAIASVLLRGAPLGTNSRTSKSYVSMDSITSRCILIDQRAVTYDQLIAFLAVANDGAFTAASNTLHKSQPAVSKLVRNLEDELGVALFDRSQYRATLTDAGRLFHERAAAVIESTEALRTFGMQLA